MQVDESTDFTSQCHPVIFIRFVSGGEIQCKLCPTNNAWNRKVPKYIYFLSGNKMSALELLFVSIRMFEVLPPF